MYPALFTTPGVRQFAEEIDAERQRQLTKFGEQHHPDIEPRDIPVVTHHYYASRADIWKQVNAERATPSTGGRCAACPGSASGPHTHTAWDGVLLEEVYEALAESEPAKLRAELVQVAAVCAAWIADIDSRTAAEEQPAAGQVSAPLPPELVSAILRDPDSPYYPSQITVVCDHCGAEDTSDYMVREDMTPTERLGVARKHLVTKGWEHDAKVGDDFCPVHASTSAAECAACRTAFDPADSRHDGRARYGLTDHCRRCVDRCHEGGAEHVCLICDPARYGGQGS
ncbi:hypothetical protein GPA10_05045 [Streptomyces sp. p1417]|uniref:Uncharacterized protein n=1 Tax=Streptomyces typhae TaxID=2681492 RepID=A0A6L6WPK3_9ACTN|nr:hypothetical protein [Streptomyces typhae]MVO84152.1 hypothetical protein [Streptomyces typhae]